jgi:chromosome segregation ATPase
MWLMEWYSGVFPPPVEQNGQLEAGADELRAQLSSAGHSVTMLTTELTHTGDVTSREASRVEHLESQITSLKNQLTTMGMERSRACGERDGMKKQLTDGTSY